MVKYRPTELLVRFGFRILVFALWQLPQFSNNRPDVCVTSDTGISGVPRAPSLTADPRLDVSRFP